MLKRLPVDLGHVEPAQDSVTGASPTAAADPVEPDPGVRRLGWLVLVGVIVILVAAAAAITKLPGLWGSDRPASPGAAPAATWVGDFPGTGDTASTPAGTPTNPIAMPSPLGGPGMPGDPSAGVPGQAATPGASTTTAPAGAAGSGTASPAPNNPTTTAAPTALPPDVQAALNDLSAEISDQVAARQLDPVAGDDLQGKVHQVAREASEGDWTAARYYAGRIRDKLRKYLDDGFVTSAGYRALISKLDAVDAALS